MISDKLAPFGTTIFAEMTALAQANNAINLSQGFPDFDGPSDIIDAAVEAMRQGQNQYARSMGHPKLVRALQDKYRRHYDLDYDAMSEIVVFSGATEGIASSLLGILNPGDEVIVFEPFYDSYPACLAMAQATPKFCTLEFPEFRVTREALEPLFSERTRLLILNTPHNPTGKVFTKEELEIIADLCRTHDVLVLSDEVYEHLTFDDHDHIPIATLDGMRERTLTLSSTGKTYSFTGWKIGWGVGPKDFVAAAQSAHQFVTYATCTPSQIAMAFAIETHDSEYFRDLKKDYTARRDRLLKVLETAGFEVFTPQGTYFVLANFERLWDGDDRSFCRHLAETIGVAAIPPSVFYQSHPEAGSRMVRFAFCKSLETIDAAGERLQRLKRSS